MASIGDPKLCVFCGTAEDDEADLGKLHEKADVVVHYFCMLLSSGLIQNTRVGDKKGILGFTVPDIKKEVSRGKRLKCTYCKHKGATIGCCLPNCKKAFHLPCGRKNGTMHHFYGEYRSYCQEHRVQQQVTPKKSPGKRRCIICLSAIDSWQPCDTLSSPCCIDSSFHRRCIQHYAISAGLHFFKCPKCNNVEQFKAEMLAFGIYLPDQDASWEKEPGAFDDLYQQHETCNAVRCQCPRGRTFNGDSGPYKLEVCQTCGAFGSHQACKALIMKNRSLVCPDCTVVLDNSDRNRLSATLYSVSDTPTRRKYGVQSSPSSLNSRLLRSGRPFDADVDSPEIQHQSPMRTTRNLSSTAATAVTPKRPGRGRPRKSACLGPEHWSQSPKKYLRSQKRITTPELSPAKRRTLDYFQGKFNYMSKSIETYLRSPPASPARVHDPSVKERLQSLRPRTPTPRV